MNASFRMALATLFGSVSLLVAPAVFAAGEPCFNDTDCPGGGGDVCGGDVCKWGEEHPMPVGEKRYVCVAAGTDPKGADGWCTIDNGDANCKCRAQGARCTGIYCSFTKASDAPAGGGSGAGGSGTAGTGTAGTPTAGSGTAGTGTTTPPAEEGGCSMGAPGRTSTGVALGVGLLGLGLAAARRRRSSVVVKAAR